jgi:broad specificity phosphatase PhoE
MRAIFVRHGESTGNAGSPCHDLAKLELTEKGRQQARQRFGTKWAICLTRFSVPLRRICQIAFQSAVIFCI